MIESNAAKQYILILTIFIYLSIYCISITISNYTMDSYFKHLQASKIKLNRQLNVIFSVDFRQKQYWTFWNIFPLLSSEVDKILIE
jgi:hypothetical protein